MFQATRRRLALWYAAVTAVLLVFVALGFYSYARATLIERVDDTLNHVVEVVARSLAIESVQMRDLAAPSLLPPGRDRPLEPPRDAAPQPPVIARSRVNLEASFRDNAGTVWDDVEEDRIDLEWFGPNGTLLWSTFSEPLNQPLHPNNRKGATVRVARAPCPDDPDPPPLVLRQVVAPVRFDGELLGFLRASHPWFEVSKPTRQLGLDLALGAAAIALAVGAIAWFLSGLAMEPVRASYQRLRQFTADASHELRNPIATIQTTVQVALAEPAPPLARAPSRDATRTQLETLERLARRLGRLVDDLLFLARHDSDLRPPAAEWVELDALLLAVADEQEALARCKQIAILPEIAPLPADGPPADPPREPPPPARAAAPHPAATQPEPDACQFALWGDRDRLARLLTNLIGNAVQYTPPGGKVWVRLFREGPAASPRRAFAKRLPRKTATLRLEVADTGIGIPADALPHLFDRFYRADPARSRAAAPSAGGNGSKSLADCPPPVAAGSGLGLSIVQAIVRDLQGQVRVASEEGRGTTVTVLLPVLPPHDPPAIAKPLPKEARSAAAPANPPPQDD